VFDAGLAHTVLAVPLGRLGSAAHLDTVCTVVDVDTVVMYPSLAFTLTAHTITPRADGMRVSRAQPFLEAAAQAMGIDRLKVINTGVDPLLTPRQQWDDGSNALAIDRRVVVCHERNIETNARLEAAGVQVIRVPASELGSARGGPRCMTCPVARDPAASPDAGETVSDRPRPTAIAPAEAVTEPGRPAARSLRQLMPSRLGAAVPAPSRPAADLERGEDCDQDQRDEEGVEEDHVDHREHKHDHDEGRDEAHDPQN
jgi:Arginine deiminase